MAGGPDLLEGAHEEGEDEGSRQNAESRAPEVIPEAHPGQPHAEVHERKGEIDQAQVEHGGKAVSFNGFIVFLEPVADEGGGEFPPQVAPDEEGARRAQHRRHPDVDEPPIGTKMLRPGR